jgi:hypothetical protein
VAHTGRSFREKWVVDQRQPESGWIFFQVMAYSFI